MSELLKNHAIAASTAVAFGLTALSGCGAEYSGVTKPDCDAVATLSAEASHIEPAAIVAVKELNGGDLKDAHFADGFESKVYSAMKHVYAKRYHVGLEKAENNISLQAGDTFTFCLEKDGTIDFDKESAVITNGWRAYTFADGKWKRTTNLAAKAQN